MRRKLSDQEFHALYCPVKNTKSALFLVACFSVTAFVGWKGLYKPPENPSYLELVFAIIVVGLLTTWLAHFTCFRERLVLSVIIVSLVTEQVESFEPSLFSQHTQTIRFGSIALSLLGLIVSVTMLVQSARTPKIEPSELQAPVVRHLKRDFLIVLAFMATILLLGSLLYFAPLRQ